MEIEGDEAILNKYIDFGPYAYIYRVSISSQLYVIIELLYYSRDLQLFKILKCVFFFPRVRSRLVDKAYK